MAEKEIKEISYEYDYPRVARICVALLFVVCSAVSIWANIWIPSVNIRYAKKINIAACAVILTTSLSLLAYTITYETYAAAMPSAFRSKARSTKIICD